jgi:RimJ/RimL family protein N-acetyltransferase
MPQRTSERRAILRAMEPTLEPLDLTLRNGRTVRVRAMVSTDEEEILQAFGRLGTQSRYMRFMHSVREVNRQRLRDTLASFPEKGLSIAATVPAADGIDIVGAATYIVGPGPQSCEFAVSVADDWGGAGLGSALLSTLIEAARRRGLHEMTGFVLAENRPMLRLASRLGFESARDPDDYAVRVCRLALGEGA